MRHPGGPALDGGLKFNDGRPVLGSHKTIRGAIVGVLGGAMMGLILSVWRPKFLVQGLLMGVGAMVGDALGSFIKRRLGIAEGKWLPLVDELPFFYTALLFASPLLPADIGQTTGIYMPMYKHNRMLTKKYAPKHLEDIIGNESVKNLLRQWAKAWLRAPQPPILLYGRPGNGKTSMALALANDMGWDVIEINASMKRDYLHMRDIIEAAKSRGLDGRLKLILIDDVDQLGSGDIGGFKAIIELLKAARNPVILTANDPFGRKVYPLRRYVKMVEVKPVPKTQILAYLKKIAALEGIETDQLEYIAERAMGDVRSALNDLETLIPAYRDRELDPFRTLYLIFKGGYRKAKFAISSSGMDYETLRDWLFHNLTVEFYDDKLYEAMRYLSYSDLVYARIKRRQFWGLLKYSFDIIAAFPEAVGASKVFHRYHYPAFKRKINKFYDELQLIRTLEKDISQRFNMGRRGARLFLNMVIALLAEGIPPERLGLSGKEVEALGALLHH